MKIHKCSIIYDGRKRFPFVIQPLPFGPFHKNTSLPVNDASLNCLFLKWYASISLWAAAWTGLFARDYCEQIDLMHGLSQSTDLSETFRQSLAFE